MDTKPMFSASNNEIDEFMEINKYIEQCGNFIPKELSGVVDKMTVSQRIQWLKENIAKYVPESAVVPQLDKRITHSHLDKAQAAQQELIVKKMASGIY